MKIQYLVQPNTLIKSSKKRLKFLQNGMNNMQYSYVYKNDDLKKIIITRKNSIFNLYK